MLVAEVVSTLLDLDQKAEAFFTKRDELPYVYLVSKLPDGTPVMAEMPTAILKISEDKI